MTLQIGIDGAGAIDNGEASFVVARTALERAPTGETLLLSPIVVLYNLNFHPIPPSLLIIITPTTLGGQDGRQESEIESPETMKLLRKMVELR